MAHPNQIRTGGKARIANFVGIERSVMDTAAFISLSKLARALYLDLRRQYNGRNNGDITIADEVLKPYGWAHSSIHKGVRELIKHGLIVRTRKGGITAPTAVKPSLYAFCDLPVMANPAKGIAGAAPSLAYYRFTPEPRKPRTRKLRVHSVNATVHAMNENALERRLSA